ncbi:hypothetical protein M0R45_033602 [Rubus argutus]|uniref:Uncharacterized protein n=1 Tax=Rubus argutus TaxID=59490 RepID=A0AAW1WNS6_RUBAR
MSEKHYFFSRVLQRETREAMPGRYNRLLISFYLLKQSRCWYDDPTSINSEISIAANRNTMIRLSYIDHRGGYAQLMARHLSIMGIPQEEQPIILEKLFQAIQVALPLRRILMLIADITARLLGSFDDHDTMIDLRGDVLIFNSN